MNTGTKARMVILPGSANALQQYINVKRVAPERIDRI
jgi:hypothetical protein